MEASDELRSRVEAWLAIDPDPETRAELKHLIDHDPVRAATLFDGRVAFGTAGLRAEMGPGPTRMNRVVVAQTTAGLMGWLPAGARVVIGFDGRHRSGRFAADAAAVVAGAGGRAELLAGPVPTPVLARAVLDRSADAGVMITASHNPPADNGYKLYLADGIQLVGPADAEIAALIDQVAAAGRDELAAATADATAHDVDADADAPAGVTELGSEVLEAHLAAAVAACVTRHRAVNVVYTAMHGVAGRQLLAAFQRAGFPPPSVVAEQFEPDPDFPTVTFPNPEEPGALDLALAQAAARGGLGAGTVDVVLANDPDGDRLAVAVPDRTGDWVRLSGDQVGVLLADHLIAHSEGPDRLVASSLVSSQLISALARAEGVEDVRTLTGFKWVARPIVDRPRCRYLLGYEEALGYCVGDRVRDKDGISAALVVAELVAGLKAQGQTVWDRLDALALRFGVHATAPVTFTFTDGAGDGDGGGTDDGGSTAAGQADGALAIVDAPPDELAGSPVVATEDLAQGLHLPPTPGAVWHLADGSRVVVRPSGTEPKLKAYIEVIEPVPSAAGLAPAQAAAEDRLARLQAAVAALFRAGRR